MKSEADGVKINDFQIFMEELARALNLLYRSVKNRMEQQILSEMKNERKLHGSY